MIYLDKVLFYIHKEPEGSGVISEFVCVGTGSKIHIFEANCEISQGA